ncbi:RES family NAD+ phosphorylase [Thalassococcus sp. S3]|uniref:RES family NAD+ phosphorylase n=1 Tax=Thalassococcus sp. S3 TaxID=2017482 RepID=UPI0010243618|nr:RES family NAD+ phosphorylase [Thalassococcus sp. S3]QBF31605.1 hypothetical protein CFI11_10305 [Thalassococcus sp. S3]
MVSLTHFNGPVWRLLPRELVDTPNTPAQAPEGRFHHSGQIAAYTSLTAEGAAVAIRRYLDDGIARALVPMWLNADRVADERGNRGASRIWQDIRAAGHPSPTWVFSDAARKTEAHAMLYSSRSRPDLSHVVVFRPDCLTVLGPITAFNPDIAY